MPLQRMEDACWEALSNRWYSSRRSPSHNVNSPRRVAQISLKPPELPPAPLDLFAGLMVTVWLLFLQWSEIFPSMGPWSSSMFLHVQARQVEWKRKSSLSSGNRGKHC